MVFGSVSAVKPNRNPALDEIRNFGIVGISRLLRLAGLPL
jgi:hypothetical protein